MGGRGGFVFYCLSDSVDVLGDQLLDLGYQIRDAERFGYDVVLFPRHQHFTRPKPAALPSKSPQSIISAGR